MSKETANEPALDQTLRAPVPVSILTIVELLRFHGIASDGGQLLAELGPEPAPVDIMRVLGRLGLRVRARRLRVDQLPQAALPAIAVHRDGTLQVIGGVSDTRVLVFDCAARRPSAMPLDRFVDTWAGVLIQARRQGEPVAERGSISAGSSR